MFGELVKSIESAFVDFSLRRALYVFFVLALIAGGLSVFDRMTGYSSARRLDAQLSALERLHALEKAGIRESAALAPIYNRLVAQQQAVTPMVLSNWYVERSEAFLKFLAGAGIPLLFVVVGSVQLVRGQPGAGSTIGGATVAATVMGVAAMFVPTVQSLRLTLLSLFFVQVLLMYLMVRNYGKKSRAG